MWGAEAFRKTIGGFATGVTVVTAADDGDVFGITVNSLTSVSLDPLLLLVCLTPDRPATEAIERSKRFVVNLLEASQQRLAVHFADKSLSGEFESVSHTTDDDGIPILDGGLGFLRCRVVEIHEGGDHRIFLAEVVDGGPCDGEPLLFHGGRYRRIAPDG